MNYKLINAYTAKTRSLKDDLLVIEQAYALLEDKAYEMIKSFLLAVINKYFTNAGISINYFNFICINVDIEANVDILRDMGCMIASTPNTSDLSRIEIELWAVK